jgi:hypothetical protein
MVDPQFRDSLAHWLGVARIPQGKTADADVDTSPGRSIPKAREPLGIGGRLTNFKHDESVSHGIRKRDVEAGLAT